MIISTILWMLINLFCHRLLDMDGESMGIMVTYSGFIFVFFAAFEFMLYLKLLGVEL